MFSKSSIRITLWSGCCSLTLRSKSHDIQGSGENGVNLWEVREGLNWMACSSAGAWRPERFVDCKGQNQYQGIFLPVFPELLNPSPDAFLLLLISPGLCFQIPDKQYVLTALAARAKLRAWHDVDALFTTKVGALGLSALWWRCVLPSHTSWESQVSRLYSKC